MVDDELSEMFREYQFRKVFNCNHEDYLNQPRDVNTWMLEIHNRVEGIKNAG